MRVKVIFSALAFLALAGCSETMEFERETNRQAQTDCDSEYDSCVRVHFDEMRHWQDTIPESGEPSWREYSESEHERTDGKDITIVTVRLDASEFHQGIMRKNPSTGEYQNKEEFLNTRNDVLGLIPRNLPDDHRVIVRNSGKTQKISVDEQAESVTKLPSSGDFLIDALTNSDGEIVIDGEIVHSVADSTNQSTSGLKTAKSSLRTGMGAGNWSADIALGKAFAFFGIVNARSKVDDFERNGKTTRTVCDWFIFGCDKKKVLADRIEMDAYWLMNFDYHTCVDTNDDGVCDITLPRGIGKSDTDWDSDLLRLSYWSSAHNRNVNEQCAKDKVCDGSTCETKKVYTRNDGTWYWASTRCGPAP